MPGIALRSDAGLSLVELLVGLVILAALTTVIAAAVQARPIAGKPAYDRVTQLIAEARLQTLTSGKAQLLIATATSLKAGEHQLAWDRSEGLLGLPLDVGVGEYRAILFPDGSISGPPLRFVTASGSRPLPGVSRSAVPGAR